ncbi:cryptochrome/photolyase family protein [Miltoncostaea marina]|uniref:cryptochrome/photolyase family protein n=1 Tax=Miltoncostaea marina TaxID=2843215 RepID=UPI001C3C50A2|nr:deoxyribodipyrimidine photo-lyase [Miltoncostaea marina]
MRAAVVLFTRDLRVHDHPALAAAAREAELVLPLFVLDDAVLAGAGANRRAFLADSLAALDEALRARGAALHVRRGDPAREAVAAAREAGAGAILLSDDVSGHAQRRLRRLRAAAGPERIEVRPMPGVAVVPAGELRPAAGPAYEVFTPYHRRWAEQPRRPLELPLERLRAPGAAPAAPAAALDALRAGGRPSPGRPPGGEPAGRARLAAWAAEGVAGYRSARDDLAADATSRLSAYLHLGCLSPLEALERAGDGPGPAAFARQLCWRDFHAQLLAARPWIAGEDMHPAAGGWRDDDALLDAWTRGATGYPLVDAGMRQLREEGFMHNRARLVVASFLTKDLGIDWRRGAAHFMDLLADGDVASNAGNWQWVAGTGADTRPGRMLNPTLQARRYDPDGAYVRRHVPELAGVEGPAVHEPWDLGLLRPGGYPEPVVDHRAAAAAHRARRRR